MLIHIKIALVYVIFLWNIWLQNSSCVRGIWCLKLISKWNKRKISIAFDGLTDFLVNSIIESLTYLFCTFDMNDTLCLCINLIYHINNLFFILLDGGVVGVKVRKSYLKTHLTSCHSDWEKKKQYFRENLTTLEKMQLFWAYLGFKQPSYEIIFKILFQMKTLRNVLYLHWGGRINTLFKRHSSKDLFRPWCSMYVLMKKKGRSMQLSFKCSCLTLKGEEEVKNFIFSHRRLVSYFKAALTSFPQVLPGN